MILKTKIYKCQFPTCGYATESRNSIHYHHIVPKSKGGSDKPFNRIYLCPNCHTRVYVEGVTHGIHSIRKQNSVILEGYVNSTQGKYLKYFDESGKINYEPIGE